MVAQPSRLAVGTGHALGDMGDVARFNSEAAQRFLEDSWVRLVTPGLLGRDNQLELYSDLLWMALMQ